MRRSEYKQMVRDRRYSLPVEWETDEGPARVFEVHFNVYRGGEVTDFIVVEDWGQEAPASKRFSEWEWDEFLDFHHWWTGEDESDVIEQCLELYRDMLEAAYEDAMEARADARREE